jgi:hypothetical protein
MVGGCESCGLTILWVGTELQGQNPKKGMCFGTDSGSVACVPLALSKPRQRCLKGTVLGVCVSNRVVYTVSTLGLYSKSSGNEEAILLADRFSSYCNASGFKT